jgi:hypothetical protein
LLVKNKHFNFWSTRFFCRHYSYKMTTVNDSQLPEQFQLRPNFRNKFKPADVQQMIHNVLQERLHAVEYQTEQAAQLTKEISNLVRDKCTELKYERYKFIVNVVIMENRGEGVK